ncbi:MAG TPA: sigma-54-dependent Fis family transcriptional regulator [Methylibium sp.]|nr:sigma-54-dependent Fis family transcriptional regulator [Methylibium sp.]
MDRAPMQYFSRPEQDRNIMSAWERFLSGQPSDSDALRRLIDDSWRRCQIAHVNPDRDGAPPPMREDSLHGLLDEHGELLQAGTPVMADARQFLDETGTVMVLTTNEGTVLNLEGDASTFDAAERIHLMPGSSWNEDNCGTNAIGTALAIGQPVQIHSAEHYCEGIKRWTCSATVVRDPIDNGILGVIDVSGLSSTYSRQSLALVVTAASRIESRLARREMELRYRLLERCIGRLGVFGTDGVIVLDRRGKPVKANDRAEAALRALGERLPSAAQLDLAHLRVGGSLNGVFTEELPPWVNRDWFEPVFDQGERLGAVLTLPCQAAHAAPLGHRDELRAVRQLVVKSPAFERVIGNAPNLLETVGCAQRLAQSKVPVLLLGETGVGKDVFAQAIHDTSACEDGPFVALNCGGFSRELLTSELFGYVEGSFTGARRGGMVGKIEAAHGGTLFLDEIGEMPIDLQPHFLRVLEEGAIYRLGENKARKVSFRLVAATNRDLRQDVTEGRFRMDLFYRIAVAAINIPPLRERQEDIGLLSGYLLSKLADHHGLPCPVLDPEALARMAQHSWPGNVRELRNVLERALLMTPDAVITLDALPLEIRQAARPAPLREVSSYGASEPQADSGLKHMEQVEKAAIVAMIRREQGNMTAVARELGIAKSTLYVKLKKFDIALTGGALGEGRAYAAPQGRETA